MDKKRILCLLGGIIEKSTDELIKLSENTPLTDIGLDSIGFIRFVTTVENEFDIEILDSDLLLSNFGTLEILFETLNKYFVPRTPIKKVLICDCDNVLWRGISGEEALYLDEKTLLFQEELVRLYHQGLLLCLCSRNAEENISWAFETLHMPLKKEHIVLEKINFNDKASNIKVISDELNLSMDSFVFIDDSDYDIGLVNAMLPEVETEKVDFNDPNFIEKIRESFQEQPAQDLNRTKLYSEQKDREKSKLRYTSVEDYNASLRTSLVCVPASLEQAERLAELSQRTNQFNLSGLHYSKSDVENLINSEDHAFFSLLAADKYGDMGIVGAAVINLSKTKAIIESFFLSCRVFGRDFEKVLLDNIKTRFTDCALYGVYIQTEKNRRFCDFYLKNEVNIYEQPRNI